MDSVERIARICHEVNRAYCQALGDFSQSTWEETPESIRQSAIYGVEFHLANPKASPSASHEKWMEYKRAEGWSYGPVKDLENKTHPCFLPYNDLPLEQRVKDYLFKAVVTSAI